MCYQSCDKPFLLFFSPFSFSPYVAICPAGCPTNSQCTAPGQCTSVCMIKKNCKQIKLFMRHECIFFSCSCLSGWSGDSCDQCIPATGCGESFCSLVGSGSGYGVIWAMKSHAVCPRPLVPCLGGSMFCKWQHFGIDFIHIVIPFSLPLPICPCGMLFM